MKNFKTFHFLTNILDTSNSDNPAGPARVTIPRTIRIGEIEFSVADTPELANLVSLVRQDTASVEKTKLYTTIDKLKKDIEVLTNVELINPSGNADKKGEEIINTIVEAKMDGMLKELKGLMAPLLETNQRSQAAIVESYRNKVLAENVGKCIPELVVGETTEAIDTALANSLQLFGKYKSEFGVRTIEEQLTNVSATPQGGIAPSVPVTPVTTPTATPSPQATPAPTNTPAPTQQTIVLPSSPANTEVPNTEIPSASTMSIEEFGKRREELQRGLKDLVGQ